MHHDMVVPSASAPCWQLNMEGIALIENLAVKRQGRHASEAPSRPPGAELNGRRARKRPPPSSHTDDRPIVARDADQLVVLTNRVKFEGANEPVMSGKQLLANIHSHSVVHYGGAARAIRGFAHMHGMFRPRLSHS